MSTIEDKLAKLADDEKKWETKFRGKHAREMDAGNLLELIALLCGILKLQNEILGVHVMREALARDAAE